MKRKEVVPNDTAYNKLYPFPANLPKWLAIATLVVIGIIFAWTFFTAIL